MELIDGYAPEQIIILGGDDIMPFCRILGPLLNPDDDGWIYSDSPDTWSTRQNTPSPGVARMLATAQAMTTSSSISCIVPRLRTGRRASCSKSQHRPCQQSFGTQHQASPR
jgi:hypothetical protein